MKRNHIISALFCVALLALGVAACWTPTIPLIGASDLEHYRGGLLTTYTQADGLPSNTVTCVLPTADTIWIGTDNGLAAMNRETGEVVVYNRSNSKLPHNEITALAIDTRERVWVGTARAGVVRIGRYNWDVFDTDDDLPSNVINCIYAEVSGMGLDDDNVWIGTKQGLVRYNADGWFIYYAPSVFAVMQPDGMLDDDVKCITVDDAFLWVGGEHGVARFNEVNWKKFTPEGALDMDKMEFIGPERYPIREDEIAALAYDGREYLYVAARRCQIAMYDGDRWIEIAFEPGASIRDMIVNEKGELWVARHNALDSACDLRRYDPDLEVWQVMTVEDGLPSNDVNDIFEEGNDLWLATAGGLAWLRRNDAVPASAVIRDIE